MTPSEIPETMRALTLSGAGFEHLRLSEVPVPRPGPRQMLGRVEAAGVCTSLIKIVEQGPAHSQIYGWDLSRTPLILGDEGSVTLVEVGAELSGNFSAGQRCAIQPAVDHPPVNWLERYRDKGRGVNKVAVGYTLPGQLAEYVLLTEESIEAGCVIPLPDQKMPAAHAALAEPVSCCVSAQEHHLHLSDTAPTEKRSARNGLKPGGVTVIIGAGAMGRMHVDVAVSYVPRTVIVADFIGERLALTRELFSKRYESAGVELYTVNPGEEDLPAILEKISDSRGADDVIVAVGSRPAIESAQALCGRGAVLNLFGGLKKGEDQVLFDTGAVHYREINITGSSGGFPWDLRRALELMSSGRLEAAAHITRIGDLDHAVDFIRQIKERKLDGKAIIYPHRRSGEIRVVKNWTAGDEREYLEA